MQRSLVGFTIGIWIAFAIYSYVYIDLNLTLSAWEPYQAIQRVFIQFGYFHRSWSAATYLLLVLLTCSTYILLLYRASAGRLSRTVIWRLIIIVGAILVFAYPALSHDLFNYMFYGKIMTVYQENPYLVRALDFPDDSWTRFMRWTHGVAPYGPFLLGLTLVPSVLGFGKFTITLILFKLFMFGGFLLCLVAITRIVEKTLSRQYVAPALVFFGLNPLILIEGLMNAHNDLVFMSFALLGIAALLTVKKLWPWISLGVSIGIKYATALFALPFVLYQTHRISWIAAWWQLLGLMVLAAVIASAGIFNRGSTGGEFLPWYLLWPLSIVALRPSFQAAQWLAIGASVGGLLYYIPYIYYGNYSAIVMLGRMVLFYIPIVLAGVIIIAKKSKC